MHKKIVYISAYRRQRHEKRGLGSIRFTDPDIPTYILQSIGQYCQCYGKNLEDVIKSWQGFVLIGKTASEQKRP